VPTNDNLKAAFAGESQASRKYMAFARKAEAERLPQVAKLFRAAAEAETVHAQAHLRVLGGVKSTAENLQVAIDGEAYEFREMYPKFVAQAEQEDEQGARNSFRNAMRVEQMHHALYTEALQAVKAGKDLPAADIFVCAVCGNTAVGAAPDKCPVCGARREQFTAIP
jgi:rubrerythrin